MIGLSFSGAWYLQEAFALRMHDIILPRLRAGREPLPPTFRQFGNNTRMPKPSQIDRHTNQQKAGINFFDEDGSFSPYKYDLYLFAKAGGGDVAVIPIDGTMSRQGICGYGNEYVAKLLKLADTEPTIKAVVLKINSPGGTVDSTRMLADTVRNFSKTIYVWTPFCASAAYYVASQSDQIWLEDQSVSEVGSIGVLMVYVDQSKALIKEGYEVEIFRANGSEQKALVNGVEPLSKETRADIQASLDNCRTEFIGYVRVGRAGKITTDDVFTGAMFGPQKAVEYGLIDRIGSLDACIAAARLAA